MRKITLGISHLAHKATLLVVDLLIIALSFFIASQQRLGMTPDFQSFEFISLSVIIVVCVFLGNGYSSKSLGSTPRLPFNTLLLVIASAVPCTVFIYSIGPEKFTNLFGRGILPVALVLTGIFAIISRVCLNHLFNDREEIKRVLIIGSDRTQEFVEKTFSTAPTKFRFEQLGDINAEIHSQDAYAIIVSPELHLNEQEQKDLLLKRLSGTPIFSVSDFFESFLFLIPVNEIDNDWFIRAEGFTMLHSAVTIRLKRMIDLVLSLLVLVLSIPLIFICAVIIKMTSSGPVFFSQKRVGLQGEIFTIYKLRTMQANAEQNGAQWAQSNDSRIFPFGHFLRTSRLDELPQCWNILKGEMSFVGPRPERPEFTSLLSEKIPYYDLRHIVKPGLTGWAQVCYPYGASIDDSLRKLQYELYYIKNYSMLLDLNILIRTVLVSFQRAGR